MNKKNILLTILMLSLSIFFLSNTSPLMSNSLAETNNKTALTMTAEPTSAQTPENRRIFVTGEAAITVVPDIAYLSVTVETTDENTNQAQEMNNQKTDIIINILKSFKIYDENIKTTSYNIYPKYEWTEKENKLIGYAVSNTINITIKDITIVGNLLNEIGQTENPVVSGIRFDISDSNEIYNQALVKAIENAEQKAKTMIKHFNYETITPITITELSSDYNTPIYKADVVNAIYESGTPYINEGTQKIKAIVNIEFEF